MQAPEAILGLIWIVLFGGLMVWGAISISRHDRKRREFFARVEARNAAYREVMAAADRRDDEGVREAYKKWCELSR